MSAIYELLLLFYIYAFLGWCVEVCFQAVTTGKIVNRGFLNGPWCPIYGVGMLGVLLLLKPVMGSLPLLFLLGMAICSLVELVVGWLLEKIFHTRWWDYSDQPFQLGGYICLKFSIMWGLAVTFTVRLIHPAILGVVKLLPTVLGLIFIAVLTGAFVADFIVTLVTIVGIRKELGELQTIAGDLHQLSDTISEKIASTTLHAETRLEERKDVLEQKAVVARGRLEERRVSLEQRQALLRKRLFSTPKPRIRRLTGAFPALKKALQERHGER